MFCFVSLSVLVMLWRCAEAMSQKSKAALNRYLTKLDRGDTTVTEDADIDPRFVLVCKLFWWNKLSFVVCCW